MIIQRNFFFPTEFILLGFLLFSQLCLQLFLALPYCKKKEKKKKRWSFFICMVHLKKEWISRNIVYTTKIGEIKRMSSVVWKFF